MVALWLTGSNLPVLSCPPLLSSPLLSSPLLSSPLPSPPRMLIYDILTQDINRFCTCNLQVSKALVRVPSGDLFFPLSFFSASFLFCFFLLVYLLLYKYAMNLSCKTKDTDPSFALIVL